MTISDLLVGFIMAIRKGNTSQTNFNISVIQGENASVIVVLQENATKPSTSIQSDHITVDTVEDVRQLAVLNVLILIAFHIEKKLRTYTNQYILNITISDLLVGLLFSLSAMTVAMNALILRAFHIERKLRTYSNQYILNITISDLLVGIIMAIRSTVNLFRKWIFGDIVGHFFLGIQNSVIGVSVLGIIAIASDRYVATSYPILHFQRKKKRIAHLVNGLTWVVALSFWIPITTIWNLV
ncbi:probable G-protein coupled receptor No9 [Strongylocentrotus purpuratus]|uniref:G-protein coupled receptors family 1 profile domain-containing protein n=1 Tax=Strongylocentrotus purpuratus TaxID=7668 RepID=A0A7M7N6H1_STRPU|nr:probable G-protein coupled receptor No9 [Strongylocentrotus purpuratus]